MATSKCTYCKKPSSRGYACSRRCLLKIRRYMSRWRRRNRRSIRAYMRRRSLAKPLAACISCDSPRTRGSWSRFCSPQCKAERFQEYVKARRDAVAFSFLKHKEKLGCARCGYRRYGGSLDYHHADPTKKRGRITAAQWRANSVFYRLEVKKCVLLCKNCHYEEHEERVQIKKNGDIR